MTPKSKIANDSEQPAKKAKANKDAPEQVPDAQPNEDGKVVTVDRGGASRFLTSVKYHIDGTLASPLKSKAQIALQVLVTIFCFYAKHFCTHYSTDLFALLVFTYMFFLSEIQLIGCCWQERVSQNV